MKTVTLMAYNLSPKYVFVIRQYIEMLTEKGIPFTLLLRGDAAASLKGDTRDPDVEYIFFGLNTTTLTPYKPDITYYLSNLDSVTDTPVGSNVLRFLRDEYIQGVCQHAGLVYKPFKDLITIISSVSKKRVLDSMLGLPRDTFDEVLTYLQEAANVKHTDIGKYERFIWDYNRTELTDVLRRSLRTASLHGVDITWCNLTPSLMSVFNKDKSFRKPFMTIREPVLADRDMLHIFLPPKEERTQAQHSMVEYLKRFGASVYALQLRVMIDANTDLNSL